MYLCVTVSNLERKKKDSKKPSFYNALKFMMSGWRWDSIIRFIAVQEGLTDMLQQG